MGIFHQALIQASILIKKIRLGRSHSLQSYQRLKPDCMLSGCSRPISYVIKSNCCIPDLADYDRITRAINNRETVWYYDWDDTLVDNNNADVFFAGILSIFQQTRQTHRTEILTARSSPFSIVAIIQSLIKNNDLELNTLQIPIVRETIGALRANAHKITPVFIQQLQEQVATCNSLTSDKETFLFNLIDLLRTIRSYNRNPWHYDEMPDSQIIIFTNENIRLLLDPRYLNPKVTYLTQQHGANNTPYLLVDDREDTNSEINRADGQAVHPHALVIHGLWIRLTQGKSTDNRQADVLNFIGHIKRDLSPWIEAIMQQKNQIQQSRKQQSIARLLARPSSRIAPVDHTEQPERRSKKSPSFS